MLNDYFNPNAMKPGGMGAVPNTLGMMSWSKDRDMYEHMVDLQRQLMGEHIRQQQMSNQVFNDKDVASAKSTGQKMIAENNLATMIADNASKMPDYAKNINLGRQGEALGKAAEGETAYNLRDVDQSTKRLKAQVEQWGLQAQDMEMRFKANPMDGQATYTEFRRGLPKDWQARFPETYSKETMDNFLKAAENNMAQRQKIAVERTKDVGNENIAYINGMFSLLREREKGAAKARDYNTMLRDAKTPEHQLSLALQIDQDPDAPMLLKQKARTVANAAATQIATKWGVKLPAPLPGLPDHPVQSLVDQLRQLSPQQPGPAQTGPTLADLRKMYPGRSDAELKAAYKKKTGKDIQ